MGKYTQIEKDIFSIFASAAWKSEKINTYPVNVQAISTGEEFIRVSIIPRGNGINLKSVSGVLIIDIFISAGNGPNRTSLIADKIDLYLVGKSLSTAAGFITQFPEPSSLSPLGVDTDNPTLYRSMYTLPFSYFGAS